MGRDPKAEIEITAHSRGLSGKLREARAKFGTFGAELRKGVFGKDLVEKGFWGKAGAHMVGNLGASAAGGAVSFVADQAKSAMNFEDQLVRLQIAARKTPEEMQDFGRSVREASNETGIGADQVMAAAKAYVALTGDMEGAAASSRQWARIAQATDSQVADIAGTAAALKQQLDIDPSQMEAAFSALAVQGKEGAIELKDLASQLSTIAPQWAQFGGASGKGVRGVKELGAALQVVKRGFGGDASETVTGLQSLLNAFQKNEKKFRQKGVKIYEADGKTLRNVLDIVKDIGGAKFQNATQLEHAFGRVEAYRAYIQLSQNKEVLDDLIAKAGDTKTIGRDFDAYMASPAGRAAAASQRMKNAIQEAFTPERIEKFASAMESVATAVEKVADAAAAAKAFWSGETDEQANPFESSSNSKKVGALGALTNRRYETATQNPNSDMYTEKMRDIRNRRSRAEQIREAVQAKDSTGDAQGQAGVRAAGDQFIKSEHISNAEVTRVREQIDAERTKLVHEMKDAVVDAVSKGMAKGMAKQDERPISVKADGNKIVDVQRGARANARRPGG